MVNHDHDESTISELLTARAGWPGNGGEHRARKELGPAQGTDRRDDKQVCDRLTSGIRELIARQEMFFLSTADRRGRCDSSFRGGAPGFVQVLDDTTLAYPEYHGRGVTASLANIQDNPHVGILMIDFLKDRVGLHVNGRARVVSDDLMRVLHPGLPIDPAPNRQPQVWVEVEVAEAYVQPEEHIPHLTKVPTHGLDMTQAAAGPQLSGVDGAGRGGGERFGAAAGNPAGYRGDDLQLGGEQRDRPGAVARLALTASTDSGPRREPFTVPVLADPQAWRRAAEEVLAEARQRALAGGVRTEWRVDTEGFRGWFG